MKVNEFYFDKYDATIIVEEFESLKEAKEMINDCFINNRDYIGGEDSLYILYKDGSCYILDRHIEIGRYKKTGIKSVVIDNPNTYQVYGRYNLNDNMIIEVC